MSDLSYIVTSSPTMFGSFIDIEADFIEKLKSFSKYKKGWDYGQGEAISNEVINHACYVFSTIESPNVKYSVVPNSQGGLKITSKVGEKDFLDIRINSNLTLDIIHEVGVGADFEVEYEDDSVKISFIKTYLNNLLTKLCFSSERYITTNLILTKSDLIATPLKTTEAVFLSLDWSARYLQVKAF